jgi:hypothetical protein
MLRPEDVGFAGGVRLGVFDLLEAGRHLGNAVATDFFNKRISQDVGRSGFRDDYGARHGADI